MVRVGNDVQLAPSHGGAKGRIARIEALWAEPPQRCLGNLCRYYRPEARTCPWCMYPAQCHRDRVCGRVCPRSAARAACALPATQACRRQALTSARP